VFDDTQQVAARADVNSYSVGKITLVHCSVGPAKSVPDAPPDAVIGMYHFN